MAMMAKDEAAAQQAKEQSNKKLSFDKFMDEPTTRMMLSMIPATDEKREVLETLVQASYERGWQNGSGNTAGSFLEVIIKGMDKRAERDRS